VRKFAASIERQKV